MHQSRANIKDALVRSRSLIVLCSPAAATSRWVNEEVLTFKQLGGEDRILAIIVAGEPNASDGKSGVSPEAECFPPALQFALGPDGQLTQEKIEPIAADVRPGMDGWANAKLKLVAGLLDLNFDTLRQRTKIRRLRRLCCTAAAVMIVIAGVAVLWYHEQKLRLVKSYVEQGRQELLQGRAPRAAVYLSEAYQIGEAEPSLRFLLAQAMQRLEAYLSFEGHTKEVFSAAFSPDGTRVVTASLDGTARVWETSSGQLQATLTGHTKEVFSAAFSSDGTRVVTASADNTARVWQISSGQLQATLTGHTKGVRSAAFSPDGTRVVTASADNTARMWQASSGQLQATLEGHTNGVRSAAFSPDGTRVVTASGDGTARVWQASSGQPQAILEGHTDWVISAAFSPDGIWVVTASADNTARVWEASSGQLQGILTGHTRGVNSAAFSPDGTRVVTASGDNTAKVWAFHLETRGPAEIAALVQCKALWRLDEGQLLPTPPNSTCTRRALQPHELPGRQVGRSNK
jgi:predicted oxidoreductase (fatty acid repression mutant protein)